MSVRGRARAAKHVKRHEGRSLERSPPPPDGSGGWTIHSNEGEERSNTLGRVLLAAETAAARAVAALSRLVGAGAGMTIPGKLLSKLDPGAIDRLAARLPAGTAAVSATNGKTTTSAMAAEILRPRYRLAHNRSGANLVSGVASTLLASDRAELGLFEVDEAALPEVLRRIRPRAVCLGNLFRDQLDRYGELELVASRWREAVGSLAPETTLLVNGDDPQVGALAAAHARSVVFGLDDPRLARPSLQHAADSKYCVRCGAPYDYAAAYVGHLGDYRCPSCGHSRPHLDVVGRAVELHGLERAEFDLVTPEGTRRVDLALPGLYNVYNALGAATLARALGASLDEIVEGLARFSAAFGRFERIPVGTRRLLLLLVKNPAGANEAVRTLVDGGAPRVVVVALNDAIADGRDVSWIWDVDFELLLPGLGTLVATGERAAELALRFKYAGLENPQIVVEPDLARALDRGLELTEQGGELVVLPTYTAMLALQRLLAGRGLAKPYWERAA
jgi:lipid II isoglutaminyl synthase (glutamine-hydrolysing)